MSYDLSAAVRERLLDDLGEYALVVPGDLEVVQAVYDFVADVDADTTRDHVTASAVVVSERGVLLHHHKRFGRWMQPGGHLEPGEHPSAAALREVTEETGLVPEHWKGEIMLLHVDSHPLEGRCGTHHDFRYLMTAPAIDPSPPEGESQDVAWFPFFEARDLVDGPLRASIERAMRKVLAG